MVNWSGNADYTLPEVVPERYERRSAHGKQLVVGEGLESFEPYSHKETVRSYVDEDHQNTSPERFWHVNDEKALRRGRSRRRKILLWTGCTVLLLALLGVALGAGLGIGLKSTSKQGDSNSNGTSATTPAAAGDAQGALPGSGLAACLLGSSSTLSWPTQLPPNQSSLLLFYQHYSGDIRFMANRSPGDWFGGTSKDTVVTDAKIGTPIAIRCPGPTELSGLNLFCEHKLPQRS